jgi:hypothetical protein
MPEFAYQAADAKGVRRDGVMEALSEDAVLRSLKAKGLTPLRITPAGAGAVQAARDGIPQPPGGRRPRASRPRPTCWPSPPSWPSCCGRACPSTGPSRC